MIAEHQRLGSWDLVKGWCGGDDGCLEPRIAMQIVHEAALCVSGVRPRNTLCHQGFDLLNGLPDIVSDKMIHELLERQTVAQAKSLQRALGKIRRLRGHYQGEIVAFDPHRVPTYSRRIMPKKKGKPTSRSRKVMQDFFAVDAHTGQPIAFMIGASPMAIGPATCDLAELTELILLSEALGVADKEHYAVEITNAFLRSQDLDVVMPIPLHKNILKIVQNLPYERKWAGYAIAETRHQLEGGAKPIRLIGQRSGEVESEYEYKAFAATGDRDAVKMLSDDFPARWTVEEFFNFEADMGWDRVRTMNLNIRYGKLSLALIAQAATHQLRQKLPKPYKHWTAQHLADAIFNDISGDIKVKDDTIVVTLYNVPEHLGLNEHYENLPQRLHRENIDPRVRWLYDFKVDFRFK